MCSGTGTPPIMRLTEATNSLKHARAVVNHIGSSRGSSASSQGIRLPLCHIFSVVWMGMGT